MKIKNNIKGITLIELIVVMALITVVLGVTYSIFIVSRKSFDIGVNKTIVQQDARVCTNKITKELKLAKSISTSPIPSDDYYKLSLKPNATTGYNSVINTKYNSSGSVVMEQEFGSFIQSMAFKTATNSSKIVQFNLVVTTGKQTIPINSSVQLINTTADLTSLPTFVYYTKY